MIEYQVWRTAPIALRELVARQIWQGCAIVLAMALFTAGLLRSPEAGFAAGVACTLAISLPLLFGWACALGAPSACRAAWRLAWFRIHWFLHVSWLCSPIWAAVAFIVLLIGRALGPRSDSWVIVFVVLGIVLWLSISVAAVIIWDRRWNQQRATLGLARQGASLSYVIVTTLTILASLWLGLAGVVLFVSGLRRWLGG